MADKKTIPLVALIARNNPEGGYAVLSKYGIKKSQAQTPEGLAKALNHILNTNKEEALMDMALQHPHRDLILAAEKHSKRGQPRVNADGTSNACGCSSFAGSYEQNINCSGDGKPCCGACSAKSNADGSGAVTEKKNTMNDNLPLIIVGGIAIIAIVALFKN